MKKVLLLVVAAMMATVSASAQHEEGDNVVQPRVGITMSDLTNVNDSKMKVNVTYGVEFEHFINDEFSLAGGLLFTNQGTKGSVSEGEIKMDLLYGMLPFTANYYVLPGLAAKAGLQIGYQIKARGEVNGTKVDFDELFNTPYLKEYFDVKKFDLSIPVGLSYELYGVTLDARYNIGITKVLTGDAGSAHNKVIVVTLGYKF